MPFDHPQTVDPTDSSLTRERMVTWQDPAAVRAASSGLSGLQIMEAIRDGRLPPPPMARLVGFRCVLVERGHVAMELDPEQSLENTLGMLHGGAAATLLDTVMGCTLHTTLPPGQGFVTLDLKLTFLRPLTVASGSIRAEGRVLNQSRRNAYLEGEVRDGEGRLAVHAVGTFTLLEGRA
ncbi:PaaI family thioesterase [Zavarzinia sp. CC-PAN008]|uniref:PaaI family thioesterase n=1 Tax=Zavarzinia sp. CC-PAN008 TaxID=3243332 RepID=UPI003F745367